MIGLIVAVFVLGIVSGEPEFHREELHYKSMTIPEDIMVDKEENYVMVTVGHLDNESYASTVNIHDFNSGFSAYKNIAKGICIIESVDGTMDQIVKKINDIDEGIPVADLLSVEWECDSRTVPYEQVKRLAGNRIANFCKSYQSYQATRTNEDGKRGRLFPRATTIADCRAFCVQCSKAAR